MALVLSSPTNLGSSLCTSLVPVGGSAAVCGNARVCMLASPSSSSLGGWGQDAFRGLSSGFEKNVKSVNEGLRQIASGPLRHRGGNWQVNASDVQLASGGDSGSGVGGGFGDGKGGDGDSGDGSFSEGSGNSENRDEALAVLATIGRSLESLPKDLSAAVKSGKVPASVIQRFLELEKAPFRNWLMQFAGFKERLLADDLFLTKVGIECGVGIFTKTAAELERRRENFTKELDFVVADVIMALVADFMLVWLPAPTVALRPALAKNAGKIATFFYKCPDNAFQIALRGTSYSTLQRVGAIVRNGSKLFVVGTSASLIGTAATNTLIKLRKSLDKNFEGETEDIPIVSTSLAYGVYMAISSNLRYQVLAGVVEQRLLEPLLHNQKVVLGVSSFAVRTANTFLGSLLWVDYARWIGVQKVQEH
ncbi:hypothetical protein MPTK1_2g08400 [Marchantia polymorpha subsp. ruderalis]|uniref:Uncharacterized protein n=1 Tax=Marchantia polymorpha TaxID=3197 RepID=A0A2R6XGT8_MARPO|nr:hypothetical protein MARPO_0015s0125 [Marchantia polymorpha]BBN01561.1 hypothetical protein Mp_2g08400 [Marchantia polymorpha subsp. ruderalis]|eukprot:PTQ45327.1 hypothetical protein MARPO_0015s0125 [Marchantia polymorpha]